MKIIYLTIAQQAALAEEHEKLCAMGDDNAPGMMIAQIFGDHMRVAVIDHQKALAIQEALGKKHIGKIIKTAYDAPAKKT